jgi:hypothetical protein
MTPQIKALIRHQQRAYQARVQFLREHGIRLTPREQIEARREEDKIMKQFVSVSDAK